MARCLWRQQISWYSLSLAATLTIIAFMGVISVQNHQCMFVTLSDDQQGNSLMSTNSPDRNNKDHVQIYFSEHTRGQLSGNNTFSIIEETPNWFDNKTMVNTANTRHTFFNYETLVQNISKAKNEWFEIIQEEDYLKNDKDLFVNKHDNKSYFNYKFIIKGKNICAEGTPFLLVIIPSVVDHIDIRDAIRWTWLRAAETNSWPRTDIKYRIKHIFMFGLKENKQSNDYRQLIHESQSFGDIVLADFSDTYRNLSRKILAGLNWVGQYCKNAKFVLKTDEDTFINVPLMIEVLNHVDVRSNTEKFVLGMRHNFDKPIVVRDGRWGVSKEEYPLDFYPRYLYGHTYALSKQAVISLTDAALHMPVIAPEDALITGILSKVAGVTRITAPSFTVCCRSIFDCEVVWNQRVALPEIKNDKRHVQLWTNVITHVCNDTMPFL